MTDHPEFRPIETVPARRVWPYALLGAVLVSTLVFVIAHRSGQAPAAGAPVVSVEPQTAALTPKLDAAATLAHPDSRPAQGPNVIGAASIENLKAAAVSAVEKTKAVARGEVERESARTKSAQKEAQNYRKQNAELQKELQDAKAQIAALQQAKKGPPPTDQEQILQMLAPVLKTSSNDGRP
jgi:hypothetical protein